MIGHAHVDPMFLWRWQEGYEAIKMTVRAALARMKERDDFVLSTSSAAFFAWLERWDPDLFEAVAERIRAGQWEIVGGWWIEPDCNVPHGESFVRQALYGQRYFQEKFGVRAVVGMNPDSFGHAATLPQILTKSGCDYYVFMRPAWYEKPLPENLFWWEAPDGSRVLTVRLRSYIGHARPEVIAELAQGDFYPTANKVCFYGVGDHGGGPTKTAIAEVARQEQEGGPARFSRLQRFFEAAAAEGVSLPVVHEELQHHARGCYSTLADLKRINRQNEHALMTAEKLCAFAQILTGIVYPADTLEGAWRDLCFLQFHDTLGGTIPEEAYCDTMAQEGRVKITAQEILHGGMHALANEIDTRGEGEGFPILVFNPSAWERRDPVEIVVDRSHWGMPGEVTEDWWRQGSVRVVDDKGNEIPSQLVFPPSHAGFGRVNVCFLADLASLGYHVYHVTPLEEAPPPNPALQAGPDYLENERWRLKVDLESGAVCRLYDKDQEIQVLTGLGNRALVIDDPSDTWGHEVQRFGQVLGAFGQAEVTVLEQGPVRASLWIRSRFGDSRLEQIISLYAGQSRIDVQATVYWGEQHRMLKIEWPVNVAVPTVTSEIPYGHLVRLSRGEEEPCGRWIDVSGQARRRLVESVPYGVALLNDGKAGYDVWARYRPYGWGPGQAIMRLTVLRSPIYVFHDPNQVQPGLPYAYQDQGEHTFRYAILPHTDSWREAHVVREAAAFNTALPRMNGEVHAGRLPGRASWCQATPENAQVTVVKRAEGGDGLIIRCVETHGRETQAQICLPIWDTEWEFALGHDEIKSFHVKPDGTVREVDLLEEPVDD
jgi:alpha-mannosidase